MDKQKYALQVLGLLESWVRHSSDWTLHAPELENGETPTEEQVLEVLEWVQEALQKPETP